MNIGMKTAVKETGVRPSTLACSLVLFVCHYNVIIHIAFENHLVVGLGSEPWRQNYCVCLTGMRRQITGLSVVEENYFGGARPKTTTFG